MRDGKGLQYQVAGFPYIETDVHHLQAAKSCCSDNSSWSIRPSRSERLEPSLSLERHFEDDTSTSFAAPQDVLRDHALSRCQKADVLRRWALDAYLIETSVPKEARGIHLA